MASKTAMMMTAALLTALGAGAAKADITMNDTGSYSVWYTIYTTGQNSLTKTKQKWGCIQPGSSKTEYGIPWTNLTVYVRSERKQNRDCTGRTLHDTHYDNNVYLTTGGSATFDLN